MSETGDSRSAAADREGARQRELRPDDGRLRRGRRSRTRIQEAARALFRERGFDGATLRAIAERAGMGASSIYRHVASKEELLVEELSALQEQAWDQFRASDDRSHPARLRVSRFLEVQQRLLAADPDLTMIALRATTRPEARVARRVLALNDRTIGLLAEVLQSGRMRSDLHRDLDVLAAAQVLFHVTQGGRIPWANGLIDASTCFEQIQAGVDVVFRGLEVPKAAAATGD